MKGETPMVVRHKPILPRQNRQRPQQDRQRAPLNTEQSAALQKWVRDFQTVAPEILKAAVVEQRLFQEMLDSPTWQIAETPQPEHITEQPEPWTVGHAKVNYVEKIDGIDEDWVK